MGVPELSEDAIRGLLEQAVEFVRAERERFVPRARALTEIERASVAGFFEEEALHAARVIVLEGETVGNPVLVQELRSRGFQSIFDLNHLNAVPFEDLLIYHETINKRLLFHGLVHFVQQRVIGMERWLDLYLRGVLRTGLHVTIPIEAHAYQLDQQFAMSPAAVFSVAKEVRNWVNAGKYRSQIPIAP